MIHMSQIKVPIEKVLAKADAANVKLGIIDEGELECVQEAIAKKLSVSKGRIHDVFVERRSLDARKKNAVVYSYQVNFKASEEEKLVKRYGKTDAKILSDKKTAGEIISLTSQPEKPPVVVGMGPAGLFAGLVLARAGMKPVILERGADVEKRQKLVDAFWRGETLTPDCNVQFGEGGAGTFSDGKLNTLVKDKTGRNRMVLETFVEFGAPEEILYMQKPHIGTDRLKDVVKAMREEIKKLGGNVLFETRFVKAEWKQNRLESIQIEQCGKMETLPCSELILATGHSARDTFETLYEDGVYMEAKPFAVGVRVEHLQEMIGKNQYGDLYEKLPTADYKLTYTTKEGRGVYSFCMCPGGYVVNASSEPGRLVVNGMSNYLRDSKNANSAIVVTVSPEDFGGTDALAGIAFQRKWEEEAFKQGQGKIPVQLLKDFLKDKPSTEFGEITPCMKGQYQLANVRKVLPKVVGDSIAEGMQAFDKKIHGYSRPDTLLSGIESRTSSPVRIVRDDNLEANIHGIYPCGEGAGYAGGITSAAMDGIRVATQILQQYQ